MNMEQVKGLPPTLLDNIAGIVRNKAISGTAIREVAHTSPWIQYYKTAQPNPFANVPISNDILQLMSLTRWYEWVREHPEKPSDKVIDDDDMLDGWYTLWERNRPKQKDMQVESSKFNVESFIVARTPEEADDIYSRNNKMSRILMKQRADQVLGSDKSIKNEDLRDVRMDISIDANKTGFAVSAAKSSGLRTSTGAR
jgi:hypothetical protein